MTTLALDLQLALGAFRLAIHGAEIPLRGVTALFGPSGSGKTTLLRIVAGMERRARGRVAFADQVWQTEPDRFVAPHRRPVGFVFQDARLFDHLSVEGNLRYAERRAANARDAGFGDEVRAALDLDALRDRRPAALSGGERQRVAIARALLTRPALLLMDEPLSALDLRRRAEIIPYIEALPRRFGVPILYVTHAIEEAARIADDMAVLTDGGLVAIGPAEDVVERLEMQPLAGHFEAGVLLDGVVTGQDRAFAMTEVRLAAADGAEQTIRMPGVDLEIGQRLRLRIRARDVSVATTRPENISIRNILDGRIVSLVEEEGRAFAELLIDVGGQNLRARLTREAVAALDLAEGGAVCVLIKSVAFDRRLLAR